MRVPSDYNLDKRFQIQCFPGLLAITIWNTRPSSALEAPTLASSKVEFSRKLEKSGCFCVQLGEGGVTSLEFS